LEKFLLARDQWLYWLSILFEIISFLLYLNAFSQLNFMLWKIN
jgi:hypothetical protein